MKTISKREKIENALHQALLNHNNIEGREIEKVEYEHIDYHSPENVGDESMEEWNSISGVATIRTSYTHTNGIESSVGIFDFDADVKYTNGGEFVCTISRINRRL